MVIVKKLLIMVIFLMSMLSVTAVEKTDCLLYFQGIDCDGCEETNAHIQYLKTRYPELQVQEFEVYYSRENARTLKQYFDAYEVKENSRGLPALFMPGTYFVGSSTILDLLEGRIRDNENKACPTLEGEKAIGLVGEREPYDVLDTIALVSVTKGAFKDVFRPGMLAFVVIFLLMISSLRKKENVLQRGILAILILFILSIMFGMGLSFKAPAGISIAMGVFLIVASLIRIKGFFGTWNTVFKKIPEETEMRIKNQLRYLFQPIGFVIISFIMTILSTGKISEVLTLFRTLALDGTSNFKLFSYVFYHSIILIVVPIIVLYIIYNIVQKLDKQAKVKEPHNDQKAEKWRVHTQRVLKFVVSTIMLLIGFVLLFL
jgi:hypothetical protein